MSNANSAAVQVRRIPGVGDTVTVVKGRKVPVGTVAKIVRIGRDERFHKSWAVLALADGSEVLTGFVNIGGVK